MSPRVNTHHQIYWAVLMKTLRIYENSTDGARKRSDNKIYNHFDAAKTPVWTAPLLYILSELPSSADIFRFPHILSVETLTTGTIHAHFPPCLCNLLYDVWVGRWVSLGYIRARVNTPPSPSCSPGPKPRWMMGNRELWEKIKGKQSLKSPRWTQCPSNLWTCMQGDSWETCVETKTPPPSL